MGKKVEQVRTVKFNDAKDIVSYYFRRGIPPMISGAPGIGKSDMIKQIGRELGRPVIDVRLLLMTETDIRGIPYFDANDGTMKWARPDFMPEENSPLANAIIFFDEITQASPSVQASALQIILDRRIGSHELPVNCVMAAAGNRQADKTGSKAMIKALANRFNHLNLKPDFPSWRTWAMANNCHPDVVGFLSRHEDKFNMFDPQSPENAFATPRTWMQVSTILQGEDMPVHLLTDMISGAVGEGAAIEFEAMRKYSTKLPHPDEILGGKYDQLPDDCRTVDCQYNVVTSCISRLNSINSQDVGKEIKIEDWYSLADNFMKFVNGGNITPEIATMGIRVGIKQLKLPFRPDRVPEFKEFFAKNKKLMAGIYAVS